jgi:hypothetical protein
MSHEEKLKLEAAAPDLLNALFGAMCELARIRRTHGSDMVADEVMIDINQTIQKAI